MDANMTNNIQNTMQGVQNEDTLAQDMAMLLQNVATLTKNVEMLTQRMTEQGFDVSKLLVTGQVENTQESMEQVVETVTPSEDIVENTQESMEQVVETVTPSEDIVENTQESMEQVVETVTPSEDVVENTQESVEQAVETVTPSENVDSQMNGMKNTVSKMFDDIGVNDGRAGVMTAKYMESLASVRLGVEQGVMTNGSLRERREFMANVMSANLYGKQLATPDNPMIVPEIEVDGNDNIVLSLEEYTPPTTTYQLGSVEDTKNKKVMRDMTSEQERKAMRDAHNMDLSVDGIHDVNMIGATLGVGAVGAAVNVAKDVVESGVKSGAIPGAAIGTALIPGMGTALGAVGGYVVNKARGLTGSVESRNNPTNTVAHTSMANDKMSERIAQAEALSQGIVASSVQSEANIER